MSTTAYATFTDSLHSSDFTRASYITHFDQFLQWSKAKNPDALLKGKPKALEDRLRSYIAYLKEQGYASASIHSKLAAVRKFYDQNRITLNWKWIGSFQKGTNGHNIDRDYTREELTKILSYCNLRQKAIFLTLMSGMRIGALASHENGKVTGLHLRNLTKITTYKDDNGEDQQLDQPLYKFIIYEGDPKNEYYCFSTFEAAKALDDYLAFREHAGEKLTPDSWLFRLEFDKENAEKPEPLSREAVSTMFNRLLRLAGIRDVGKDNKRKAVPLFHGIRKYTNSRMVERNLNFVVKESLLGHAVGLEKSYLRSQESNFLREWLKVMPLVTISQEKKLQADVKRLENKVADMDSLRLENMRLHDKYDRLAAEQEQQRKDFEDYKKRGMAAIPVHELGVTTEALGKKTTTEKED